MKSFEFVLVIVSVIVGLALTEFAIGVAEMIKVYRTAHYYFPFIALIGLGFISMLNYWGIVYKLRHVKSWTIPTIGIVFISGMIFFVITRITFPQPDVNQDYEQHFNENISVVLFLLILLIFSYMLESFLIREVRKPRKYVMGSIFILVIFSGIVVENAGFRGVLIFVLLLMQLYYMFSTRLRVNDDEPYGKKE